MASPQPRISRVFGAVNIGSFRVSAMVMGEADGGEMVVLGSSHRASDVASTTAAKLGFRPLDDVMPQHCAAVRWSLNGKHEGWGMFGQPTGAQVHIMGFTHAEFGPYGLRREWTLFDIVSIWKQIFMAQG